MQNFILVQCLAGNAENVHFLFPAAGMPCVGFLGISAPGAVCRVPSFITISSTVPFTFKTFIHASTLARVLPRPYKLVLQPSYQAHGVRRSCREHTLNTKQTE